MRVRNGHWIALGALFALTAAWFLFETRQTTFWFDEWVWVLDRRDGGLSTLLEPHNGHLSLVPVAVYKLLFATAGLTEYWPYRVVVIALHLCCVALVFAYTRRRVGAFAAGLAAVTILLLGPAWQNMLWPFQIGSVTSLAAGVGALLALDRRDRRGDAAACALLALSLASSGTGVVMALGVAVELVVARRRPRDLWIVAVPAVPFALWWLAYQDSEFVRHNLVLAPGFAADAAAGTLAALTGLSGSVLADDGSALAWGRPVAAVAGAVLVWRLLTIDRVPPRAITLLVTIGALWLLTAVQRAHQASPDSSRYVYAGAVLCILLIAELARGVVIQRRARALLVVAVALAALANVGDLRDASRMLREQAAIARADLAALELSRGVQPADYTATAFPGTPFLRLSASAYLDAARALGSPALGAAELAAAPAPARMTADAELTTAHGARLIRARAERPPAGDPPTVDAALGGTVDTAGACVTFTPAAVAAAEATPELQVALPPAGLRLIAGPGAASVALRRFGSEFPATPLSRMGPASTALLRLDDDGAATPWHVRIASEAPVTACTEP